jgi:hypothetical protein
LALAFFSASAMWFLEHNVLKWLLKRHCEGRSPVETHTLRQIDSTSVSL